MEPAVKKVNWKEVIVFYAIACGFSWPFFAWRDLYPESWSASGIPHQVRNLLLMWGPGVAAIICFITFKKSHVRRITFLGTSILKSLLFYLLPFAIWATLLVFIPDTERNMLSQLVVLIPFGFLMILGEELGWRGFLQDTLAPLSEWKRWLVLGVMWEMWHFTRAMVEGDTPQIIIRKMILLSSVIVITVLIGKATERSKSLLVAITLHSWANLQLEFTHITTQITGGASLIIWILLIWKWKPYTAPPRSK